MVKSSKFSIVLLVVVIVLLLFIIVKPFFTPTYLVETKKELVGVAILDRVTLETNKPKPASAKMYSWQEYYNEDVWGREGFYMPNVYTAVDSMGLPQKVTIESESAKPIYHILSRLQDAYHTETINKYHIIIDENGFMWLDEDISFNDSRFTKRMQNDSVLVSSKKVDDIDTNNTLGPFMLKGLDIIDSETMIAKFNPNPEDIPEENNWYILEYITMNNDVIGKIDHDQAEKVTAFLEEALNEDAGFNVLLLIDILEYKGF